MTTIAPRTKFHGVVRALHWTMALLILAMLMLGAAMTSTIEPIRLTCLAWHRPIGLLILVLVTVRLAVRLATGSPPLPADLPGVQKLAAKATHVVLYATLFAMPLIGWAMLSSGGYPVQVAGSFVLPPILPQDLHAFGQLRLAHSWGALAFLVVVPVHMAAALVHGLIRRDGVLRTMT